MVNPAPLAVMAANASRAYGTANPTFTGSASGAVNGDTFAVSETTSATIMSNVGAYAIVPGITGTDISDYTVSLTNGALTITQAGSVVLLLSSGTSVNLTAPLTLTASVSSATTGTPTGTVNFLDGQTSIGSGTLNVQGVATFTTSSLAAGTHTITAAYSGSGDFTGSTSGTVIETVIPPDYSITANPAALTITAGQSGSVAFTITPTGGFNQSVQFSCSGLPVNSTCTFSPTAVTPNGAPITSTLTLQTNILVLPGAKVSQTARIANPVSLCSCGIAAVALCFLRRRKLRMLPRSLWGFILGAVLALTGTTTGCGTKPETPAGTSTVTVTAATISGSSNNPVSHTATLTVTITN